MSLIRYFNSQKIRINSMYDVGAYDGRFTREMLSYNGKMRIMMFEPTIERNIELEKVGVEWKNIGLGSVRGRMKFYIDETEYTKENFAGMGNSLVYKGNSKGIREIEVDRIGNLIDDGLFIPELLKTDTQGYDLEVIKGCGKYLDQIKYVYCEVQVNENMAECVNYMRIRGFRIVDMYNGWRDGGNLIEQNILFRRE